MQKNVWIKSSRSGSSGACVEVRRRDVWVKSSRSGQEGQCVEVRHRADAIDVRDSKDPHGPTLTFTATEWTAFLNGFRLP